MITFLYVLLICSLLVIAYFNLFYFTQIDWKDAELLQNGKCDPVSIIVCGRNELENFDQLAKVLIEQDYPNFEILFVDDNSNDGSQKLLESLSHKYSNLNCLLLKTDKNQFPGKKYALQEGIKASQHELILVTDADCRPSSVNWIRQMVSSLKENDIVVGYGPFYSEDGIWNKVFRYENVYTAVKYLSFASRGLTYMGVGRNMLYRKQLFIENEGFKSHMHVASGDDDLFISEVAKKDNVSICIHPDAYMFSPAMKGLKHYINQKVRHLSVSVLYRPKIKFLLGMEGGVHYLFHILLVFLSIFDSNISGLVYIYIAKYLIQMIGFYSFCKRSNNSGIYPFIVFLDLLYLEIYLYISLRLFFKRKITWR